MPYLGLKNVIDQLIIIIIIIIWLYREIVYKYYLLLPFIVRSNGELQRMVNTILKSQFVINSNQWTIQQLKSYFLQAFVGICKMIIKLLKFKANELKSHHK